MPNIDYFCGELYSFKGLRTYEEKCFLLNTLAEFIKSGISSKIGIEYFTTDKINISAPSDEFLNKYKYGLITQDFKAARLNIYSNASLATLASSYAISAEILNDHNYKSAIDSRWGMKFNQQHPLNTKMYLFSLYLSSTLDIKNLKLNAEAIQTNFYIPTNFPSTSLKEGMKYQMCPLALLYTYTEFLKLEWANYQDYPDGLTIQLPIFYIHDGIFDIKKVPFTFDKLIIKKFNNLELLSYNDYYAIMMKLKETVNNNL